jgi:type III pantothenate kinase
MVKLAIDFGNTRIKVGYFMGADLQQTHIFEQEQALLNYLNNTAFDFALLSHTAELSKVLADRFSGSKNTFLLDYRLKLPFHNRYNTPQTLGKDRIALAAAAAVCYPRQHVLVIDAGTCITYDFVDADANYHGGAISPGMHLRFKSMHNFTAALPLISGDWQFEWPAKDTQQSMKSGVMLGIASEMQYFIDNLTGDYPQLTVLLCGGDAKYFETKIKAHIFAVPELVLMGLNTILDYNVAN